MQCNGRQDNSRQYYTMQSINIRISINIHSPPADVILIEAPLALVPIGPWDDPTPPDPPPNPCTPPGEISS